MLSTRHSFDNVLAVQIDVPLADVDSVKSSTPLRTGNGSAFVSLLGTNNSQLKLDTTRRTVYTSHQTFEIRVCGIGCTDISSIIVLLSNLARWGMRKRSKFKESIRDLSETMCKSVSLTGGEVSGCNGLSPRSHD